MAVFIRVSIYNATLINSNRIQDLSSNEEIYIFYILYLCALFIPTFMLLIYYFTFI